MTTKKNAVTPQQLASFTSRKVTGLVDTLHDEVPDALAAWMARYLTFAIVGVRSPAVAEKIALHLDRFIRFFTDSYGHDRISTVLKRDVLAWQRALKEQGFAPATINNHLASLSGFTTWVHAQAPQLFPVGDPAKGIGELGLPPLEPRALSEAQVRSLKNLCDRLERFHQLRGQRWAGREGSVPVHATGRPVRDRAMIYVLLSTGLRREELIRLDHNDPFLCRAVCQELAGETISLKELVKVRDARRRELRATLTDRAALLDQLLATPQHPPADPIPEQPASAPPRPMRLKRYINE
jgi:site-specific recombinase XerC